MVSCGRRPRGAHNCEKLRSWLVVGPLLTYVSTRLTLMTPLIKCKKERELKRIIEESALFVIEQIVCEREHSLWSSWWWQDKCKKLARFPPNLEFIITFTVAVIVGTITTFRIFNPFSIRTKFQSVVVLSEWGHVHQLHHVNIRNRTQHRWHHRGHNMEAIPLSHNKQQLSNCILQLYSSKWMS